MSDLTVAKISRGRMKGSAEKIQILKEAFSRIQDIDTGQVNTEQTTELQARLEKAKEALDRYTEAVIRCLVLEGKEEYDPDDEHMVEVGDVEDDLDKLDTKVRVLKARVREKSTRARAEANAHEEPGNMGRVVAKPPPHMKKGITLEELETWSSPWDDYYLVTKLEKEIPALQRPNIRGHLSQDM